MLNFELEPNYLLYEPAFHFDELHFDEIHFDELYHPRLYYEEEPLFYNSDIIFEQRISRPKIKEMKSDNENFMQEKDIKYKLYPLYINWKKIEKNNFEKEIINHHYNTYKLFGFFGEAIFEILIESNPKNDYYTYKNFLKELYYLYKKKYTKEELDKNNFYKKLIDIYENVVSLVKNKILVFKEIPIFLIIFKIYQSIFSSLKENKKAIESLKNQFIILSYIKNNEYGKIYKAHLKDIDFPKNKKDYINRIKSDYKLFA